MFGIYQRYWIPIIVYLWAAFSAIHNLGCPVCGAHG